MILLWCRRCDGYHEAVIRFPTVCPRCGLDPARWTTFRPVSEPLTAFRNTVDDRAFLATLKIDGAD